MKAELKEEFKKHFNDLVGEIADKCMETAMETMQEHGRVPGTLMGLDMSCESVVEMPWAFDSPEARLNAMKTARMMLFLKKAMFYVIISEAWARVLPIDNENAKEDVEKKVKEHKWGDIEKLPDKIEMIVVTAISPLGKRMVTVKVLRDKNNKVIDFSEPEKVDNAEGAFADLLHPKLKDALEHALDESEK